MHAQMSVCQICQFQDRREDDGQEPQCLAGSPDIDYDTCSYFVILGGPKLGDRLAELYNLIDLAWGVILAILDNLDGEGDIVLQEIEVKQ